MAEENENIVKNEQTKGLKRDTIDKFYTKETVVILCSDLIKNFVDIGENDLIIEPSAGNGAFISEIKKLSKNYKFYDIDPDNNQLKWGRDRASFAKPVYDKFWNIVENEGWNSLGRTKNYDYMHFSAVSV